MLIHRLDNDDSESPASLYLHAPAIKTAIKYLNKKIKGKSKLMGEILTTSSDNTLYSEMYAGSDGYNKWHKGVIRKIQEG